MSYSLDVLLYDLCRLLILLLDGRVQEPSTKHDNSTDTKEDIDEVELVVKQ